jgi:hypothetical protein
MKTDELKQTVIQLKKDLDELNLKKDNKKSELEKKDIEIKQLKDELEKSTLVNNISTIEEYKFDNGLIVPIRSDGMINATYLCKAGNKLFSDYMRLQSTQDYLKVLESDMGIPISRLLEVNIGGHSGTWIHRKVGYHIAQWISPEFAVRVSNILDELFISGKIELNKEKSINEIEYKYQAQINELQKNLQENKTQYKTLLVKHNSSLKTHRYVKFKETGPCFYLIEQGLPCECPVNQQRYKFGISGISKKKEESIDTRLQNHRTIWPQLKVVFIVFVKDVELLEKAFKMKYKKEINPNGHEIIEQVSQLEIITNIKNIIELLNMENPYFVDEGKIKEYNDYVITTVK